MLVKINGVHRVKRSQADGSIKVHYYAWRGGPAMKAKPHTEAFAQEHARLKREAEQYRKPAMTLDFLIDHFTGPANKPNPDWLELAETTRVDHEFAFKLIRKQWPGLPVKLTQMKGMKGDIRKWHRSFAANPRKADKLLFSLSKVFSYAIEDEIIEKNPCTGISRLYNGSRKEVVWSPEQIALFREKAPPSLLLAFEIAIRTAQRQGDILTATWKQYDGTYLTFLQSKGKKRVKVLVHSSLKAMLDELPKDRLRILLNTRGRPWTKDGFKTSWGKFCNKIGLKGVTFHDLRGTFITEAAREGATAEQIAGISGHSIGEIKNVLEKHYLASDQQSRDAVIRRLEKNTA